MRAKYCTLLVVARFTNGTGSSECTFRQTTCRHRDRSRRCTNATVVPHERIIIVTRKYRTLSRQRAKRSTMRGARRRHVVELQQLTRQQLLLRNCGCHAARRRVRPPKLCGNKEKETDQLHTHTHTPLPPRHKIVPTPWTRKGTYFPRSRSLSFSLGLLSSGARSLNNNNNSSNNKNNNNNNNNKKKRTH